MGQKKISNLHIVTDIKNKDKDKYTFSVMSKCFLAMLMLCGLFIQHATSSFGFNSDHQHEEDIALFNKKFHVDYFVLAMQWPQGTCEFMNATHRHKCAVPHT